MTEFGFEDLPIRVINDSNMLVTKRLVDLIRVLICVVSCESFDILLRYGDVFVLFQLTILLRLIGCVYW